MQCLVGGGVETAEEPPELVGVRRVEEGAGQAQGVGKLEVDSPDARFGKPSGLVGDESEVELQIVPHDDSGL